MKGQGRSEVGFDMADKRTMSACLHARMLSYPVPAISLFSLVALLMDDGELLCFQSTESSMAFLLL